MVWEGVTFNARLPWLSAYMGHVAIIVSSGTRVTLHTTPELWDLAGNRCDDPIQNTTPRTTVV